MDTPEYAIGHLGIYIDVRHPSALLPYIPEGVHYEIFT